MLQETSSDDAPKAATSGFLTLISALHDAEVSANEHAIADLLVKVTERAAIAPPSWRTPFESDLFCRERLLAPCPASFWRRLSKRFPQSSAAVAAASAALAAEDLLDVLTPPDIFSFNEHGVSLQLREGSYATGGIGRFVYAAARALGTLLARAASTELHVDSHCSPSPGVVPSPESLRVLELGCGCGLVGLVAASCGASSVILTDAAAASVECASANASQNDVGHCCRAAPLDWTALAAGGEAATTACSAAGLGGAENSATTPSVSGPGWWPDMIVAADVCYSSTMGPLFLHALAHLLRASPRSTRAYVVNGWPNQGLAHFEALIGAREPLQQQEDRARAADEVPAAQAAHRPFIDDRSSGGSEVSAVRSPPSLTLISATRLTGYADHAHHLYVLAAGEEKS